MTLKEIANKYGHAKVTFDVWPKGKYFQMQATLADGSYAGTIYGDPENPKPYAAIKTAEGAKQWKLYQTKTITLKPALYKTSDDRYQVTKTLFKDEAEARESFEDSDSEFIRLATERAVSHEIQV